MSCGTWLDAEFCARLMLTLGHSLWQGAAWLVAALAAVRLLRAGSARARYGVLVAALVMTALCLPVTFMWADTPGRPATASVSPVMQPEPVAGLGRSSEIRGAIPERTANPGTGRWAPAAAVVVERAHDWRPYAPYAVGVYLVGVMVMVGRLVLALGGGHRLKQRSQPVEEAFILTALARQARALGLRFTPAVAYCRYVAVPSVVGVLRPMVLLPLAIASNMSPEQIEVLLAHELAHIRRYDHLVSLLQRLIEAAMFFHPAVWVVSRRIRMEREHCCDDLVLAAGGRRLVYAESLVRAAELSYEARRSRLATAAALGAAGAPSELGRRIRRLVGGQSNERLSLGRVSLLAMAVVAAALMLPGRAPAEPKAATTRPAAGATTRPGDERTEQQHLDLTIVHAETGEGLKDVRVDYRIDDLKGSTVTDVDGRARIALPVAAPESVSVICTQEKFVCMGAFWSKDSWTSGIQPTLTIKMEPQTSVGGMVKDEEGRPIRGAVVTLELRGEAINGHAVYPRLAAGAPGGLPHSTYTKWTTETDAEGRWRCDIVPTKLDGLGIRLTHDDYLSDNYSNQTSLRSVEALRRLNAVSVMKRGLTITGVVRNGKGEPVAKASVSRDPIRRVGSGNHDVETDAQGRFTFKNVPPGVILITVQAKGYAPELQRLDANVSPPPLDMRLGPGHTIKGLVVDQQGKAIEGVGVWTRKWHGYETFVAQQKTDAQGRFTVTDAPEDEVTFDMFKKGYMRLWNYEMAAGTREQLVVLKPALHLHGKVVDAETKQPIERFTMVPGYFTRGSREPNWDRGASKVLGRQYECMFEYPRDAHVLRIEAAGYAPGVSGEYSGDEGEVTRDFELQKAKALAGVVKGPDGKPLAGAQVVSAVPSECVYIMNGRIMNPGDLSIVVTGADGRFSLPAQDGDYALVVLANEGFAQVDDTAFAAAPEITVQRWGRIEGRLLIGAKPGVQEPINVDGYHAPRPPAKNRVFRTGAFLDYRTQTDADGRFVIERLVPDTIRIGREIRLNERPGGGYMSALSHAAKVEVKPGETARVEIGGQGRPVIGRVKQPENADPALDWSWGSHDLENARKQPGIRITFGTQSSPSQPEPLVDYPFKLESDGSFRIEDVAAGEYTLKISVWAPPENGRLDNHRVIAKAEKRVVVPKMEGGRSDEPLDVGTIDVKER